MPAREFFLDLPEKDAGKLDALFRRLAEFGQIKNVEKFKKLDDRQGRAIWEFKIFQIRFLGGFVPGGQFVIAYGVRKKKDKHKDKDLDRAAQILNEHMSRQASGG